MVNRTSLLSLLLGASMYGGAAFSKPIWLHCEGFVIGYIDFIKQTNYTLHAPARYLVWDADEGRVLSYSNSRQTLEKEHVTDLTKEYITWDCSNSYWRCADTLDRRTLIWRTSMESRAGRQSGGGESQCKVAEPQPLSNGPKI